MKKLTIGTILTIIGLLITILATITSISMDYGMMKSDVNNIKETQKEMIKSITTIQTDTGIIKSVVTQSKRKRETRLTENKEEKEDDQQEVH